MKKNYNNDQVLSGKQEARGLGLGSLSFTKKEGDSTDLIFEKILFFFFWKILNPQNTEEFESVH